MKNHISLSLVVLGMTFLGFANAQEDSGAAEQVDASTLIKGEELTDPKYTVVEVVTASDGDDHEHEADSHNESAEEDSAAEQHSANEEDHEDEDGDHDEAQPHEESEPGLVELSDASAAIAGISTATISLTLLSETVSAPGEVQLNQYTSAEVVPLIDAVVIERHARLGDTVEAGQKLVTLASVDVAGAQGQLRIASSEWQRARKLGKTAIGAKRYTEAEVAYQQARLTLGAYGLDSQQIDATASGKLGGTLGQFDLITPVAGTVLRDDFRIGQRIEAGDQLFLIADETQIWIEANLSPGQADGINVGAAVSVNMNGHWHAGTVIQKHHLLDEQTRTVPVRISVEPDGEHHHAGEFVQVSIDLIGNDSGVESDELSLVVPESALMQDDEQNWTVFMQVKPGHFRQSVVQRGVTRGARVAISGIPEGTVVVTKGAFFLASELAKSGFDIHDH